MKRKIKTLFLVLISVLSVFYIATNQIISMNKYMGMNELIYNDSLYITVFAFSILIILFLITDVESPQGILIGVFLFYSFVWFFFFYSVSGYSDIKIVTYGCLIFFLPVFFLLASQKVFKINFSSILQFCNRINLRVEMVIALILLTTAIIMYSKVGISFSMVDSYDRRLEGRKVLSGVLAYLISMTLNGLGPLLAFLSIYNKKYFYCIISIIFSFLGFGFVGTKAPIAFTLLMSLIAFYYLRGGKDIVYMLVYAMFSLIILGLIEYLIFDYSIIADVFIRRAILVVPQFQMYYLDFIFNNSNQNFSIIDGLDVNGRITFLIGELYIGNTESNANTITFLTELGQKGIFGYIFNVIFLIVFASFLSFAYKKSKHPVWLAITTIYALILLEQSYSTAFITSGVGLSVLILLLFDYGTEVRSKCSFTCDENRLSYSKKIF